MNKSLGFTSLNRFNALLLVVVLLVTPTLGLDRKGEKDYKRGLASEAAQKWEEAAQSFALALAARPQDVEYQLHYRRAVFNASQTFMIQGRTLAEQGDFVGAYNAFRKSYGYDPVNQLAQSEMERMIRLQQEREGNSTPATRSSITRDANGNANTGTPSGSPGGNNSEARVMPSSYTPTGGAQTSQSVQGVQDAPRSEVRPIINFSGVSLDQVITSLAEQLGMNVVFDGQFQGRTRQVSYKLNNVTVAQALDYIFLTQNLFFQRLGRRTILVAEQSKRPQYQQLLVRTFYLKNISPTNAAAVLRPLITASGGVVPQIVNNDPTNSITVRATPEQIRLIKDVLNGIDKDRAEVVMDVSIYEVTRTDLLNFGGQLGNESSLGNFGGTTPIGITLGNAGGLLSSTNGGTTTTIPTGFGAAIILPPLQLSALQTKTNTKLLAQTQVHAFDGEATKTRIGQRVPVQTASYFPSFGGTTGGGQQGQTPGAAFSGGFPVINYEPTGLTLNFTPTVYPNLDVQVKMEIENKDRQGTSLQPIFTERTISGTARIQNNRTMLLASIAQDTERTGRTGIPLLGLIPILGRLITTPTRDNFKSDVVIAVTPRVLRAPAITPSDELERPSGYQQQPLNESLEDLIAQVDREDNLARANQPTNIQPPSAPPSITQPVQALNAAASQTVLPTPSPKAEQPSAPLQRTNTAYAAEGLIVETTTPRGVVSSAVAAVAPNAQAVNPQPSNVSATRAQVAAKSSDANANKLIANSAVDSGKTLDAKTAMPTFIPAPLALASAEKPVTNTLTTTLPTSLVNNVTSNSAASVKTASALVAELRFAPNPQSLRVGERQQLMLMLKTEAKLSTAVARLRFNSKVIAVRGVSAGNVFANGGTLPLVSHSTDKEGNLLVSLMPASGAAWANGAGVLLLLEVEGVAAGETAIEFDDASVHLLSTDGSEITKRAESGRVVVKDK